MLKKNKILQNCCQNTAYSLIKICFAALYLGFFGIKCFASTAQLLPSDVNLVPQSAPTTQNTGNQDLAGYYQNATTQNTSNQSNQNEGQEQEQSQSESQVIDRVQMLQKFAIYGSKHLLINNADNIVLNEYAAEFLKNGFLQKQKFVKQNVADNFQLKLGYIMFFAETGRWSIMLNGRKYTPLRKTGDNFVVTSVTKDRVKILYSPSDSNIRSYLKSSADSLPFGTELNQNGDMVVELKSGTCFDLASLSIAKTCGGAS
jgi:hypothetical protein